MSFLESVFSGSSSQQQTAARVALLASAALALGYASYSLLSSSSSSSSSTSSNPLPAASEEEAQKMMSQIVDKLKLSVPRFLRAADSIKQQLAEQGQQVEDAQVVKMFVLPHFEAFIREVTEASAEEHDFDVDELEEAVECYVEAGDETLIHLSNQLKTIYKNFGGDVEEEESAAAPAPTSSLSSEVTLADLIGVLQELSEKMVEECDLFASKFVEAYGKPSGQANLEKFQMGLFQVTELIEKELLATRGWTTTDFQAILMKYQQEQMVGEIFYRMQVENKRVLDKHGIVMM